MWHVKDQFSVQWGLPADVPVPGDYNGDGRTDIAVWRPSDGMWHVKDHFSVQWGRSSDVPVAGDYDGNGTTDIAVWREQPYGGYQQGMWHVRNQFSVQWGTYGDVPVPGDYYFRIPPAAEDRRGGLEAIC